MSLLQATSLITSATKAIKTGSLPDLNSTVNALSSAGIISKSEATLVKSGLSIANSIEQDQTPSLSSVTSALSATGIINKTQANTINKNIAIGSSGLSTNTLNDPQKLLATVKSLGIVDSSTAKLLSNGLAILTAASKGNIGGVITGALGLAGVSPSVAKVAGATLNSVVSTVQDANASSGYQTTDKSLPDIGSIGRLTKAECVKILDACQKAIAKKYVVNGKRNAWRKVHNRGEYGAYRMTISQLIDIDFLKPTIQEWAENCIRSQPTGPGVSERIKSYAEAVQDVGGDYDFAPFKREAANNLQYFFLYNPIPIDHEAAVRSMITFITSEEMQDKAAYYYLKKAYVDLSNAKIINENTSKETVAGLVSIALCAKLDDAIKFSQGVIKTNADGINSKFWYDTGWNSVAETPKNVNSDKPLLKEGARQPTTEISTKALIETAKDLSDVISGKNINGVVAGLVKTGVIPGDVGKIIDSGLGIAASVIKDKIVEIDKVKDALQKASSVLPAGSSSSLKSISSIKSAVSSSSSKVPSISSLATKANVPTTASSATGNLTSSAKQIDALAKQIEDTATTAVGSAVGAVAASGKVDPASLSFVGESLKSGFGLANDPQTAVINELNRRGLCPPGSTALLRASIDGITDPAKISDLIATEVNKMGNVGAALPTLNTKLIEDTGAKKGLVDKFEQAKAASISAIGVSKPELTSLISSAGSASMESLKKQASKAADDLLKTTSTAASGLDLANNLTSVTAGANDPQAAASALGAAAVSKVSGSASAASDAVSGIAGNTQGALNSAKGSVTGSLAAASSNVTGMLEKSVPSVANLPAEGQIVSTYLPVTPATVPEPPATGTASADAVPALPSTQIAAAVGGPTQASTPPVDPNPIKAPYGSVEVAYQWTASNGVITVSSGGTPIASVNLIDKIDSRSPQYNMLMAAIDGAIKQERINNYKASAADIEKMTVKVADFTIVYEYQPERKNFVVTVTDDLKFFNSITTENVYTTAESLIRGAFSQTERARAAAINLGELEKAQRLADLGIELGKNGVTDLEFLKKSFLDKNKVGGDTALSTDLATAKTAIQSDFIPNLEKVKKTFSNNTPVAAQAPSKSNTDGTTTTVVTEKYGDGSVVKTTIVEDQKGFASTQKEVTRVAPPIATPSPNTNPSDPDTVQHPAHDDPNHSITQSPPDVANIPASNDTTSGFGDPLGQYPKSALGGKPDINPLAVGINSPHIQNDPASQGARQETLSTGASPAAKNALRKKDVPKAGRHGGSWSQPETPYAARYPYNKVTASESGHVTEIDDTPGAERLHTAHKSGTFQEIGPNGTQVTRIVGDGYTIIDSNGYVLIEGRANVHIAGECNVMIMGDTNLTMNGKVNMDVHNDFNLNVAGHFGLSVGGGMFIRNDGVFSHDNKGDMHVHSAGNFISTIDGTHNTTASGYRTTSKGDYHVKVSGVSYHTSVGNINQDTDGSILNKAAETIDSKSGTHTNIESLGNTNIKSAGSVNTESIAATNVKSANVVNVDGADSINVKSGNAVNVKSASATNVKSGAAVNVEGAGNINLKAPEVASSKFSARTIDVSTLNAASTNLTGVDPQGGTVQPINGSASPVTPGSATSAGSANSADPASEATGAKIATLANPIPVEKPVSISASPIVAGVDGNQTAGAGGDSSPINSAGGAVFDTRTFEREQH